jgi:hypothetical protein
VALLEVFALFAIDQLDKLVPEEVVLETPHLGLGHKLCQQLV